MANVSITQLPTAQTLTGLEAVPIVQNGTTVQTTTGAIANSPVLTQTFLTVGAQPELANSRYISVSTGLSEVDGGPQGQYSISLADAPLSLVTSATGFQVKTSSTVITGRSISVGSGMSITNASGVAGDPLIAFAGLMSNIASQTGTGLLAINGEAATPVTLTGTTGQINIVSGDGSAGAPTFSLAPSGVTAGSYTLTNITVDATGRITSASNGTAAGSGTVTLINTGTGLTGGPISTSGTISLANTAVAAGTYGSATQVAQVAVNAQGQITSASNVTITASGIGAVASVTGTANEITATGATSVVLSLPSALTFTGKTVTDGTFNMAAATVGADTVTTNTATQTLTNKTLTSPAINTPTVLGGSINNTIIGAAIPAAGTFTSATLTTGTVSTTPVAGTDIANKSYVDTIAAAGIHYHAPVYVESPNTAGSLNALYNQPGGAGNGVGATLTNNGTKAALTIDGVLMTTGKRVLIYNQTNAYENGVYTVTTVGTPDPGGTNWVLTRATDADTYAPSNPNSLGQGDAFFVTNGDTGAGEGYVCTTVGVIVFGTTAITFSQFSASVAYNAGTGLNLTPATTFNISNTGVTANTYGAAATVPVFIVNAQGQLTSVTDTAIAIANTAVSGLGTMSTQAANSVAITGGSISGVAISGGSLSGSSVNSTPVGATTASTGAFTTLDASSTATLNTLVSSGATLTGGTINGMAIGATTATTGAFTTVTATTGIFGGTF